MNQIGAGSFFNKEGTHRYYLWRRWDLTKPMIMFIGLNPSKANATKNDNTISKIIKVAKHNEYGGIYMLNLFSIVSKNPKDILICEDPVLDNDKWIDEIYRKCKDVVFCWGAFKEAKERAKIMIEKIPAPLCFEILLDGSPKHPLYCKDKTILIPFK